MWDISLAEQLGTTPWDVREHATIVDIIRQKDWTQAKQSGEKVQAQRLRQQQNSRSRSMGSRRRR